MSPASLDTPPGGRFLPGALLAGRYRIVGPLASGGMGEVYRADDLKLGQPVALKFLPEELAQDESRLQRFLGEVRVARQISHPSVCRVYDVAEFDGQHFISMEFVDGEDLASLLRRIGRLPGDKASQIARQICAGLAAAHQKGIVHRDLKPANVMIDGRGQARLTDFGLAGWAEQIEGGEAFAGTPGYMAPEQLAGTEVTPKSDLYALGHVLYELFTGRRVFRADSVAELSRLQREATPPSPSSVVEGLDPAVERVILSCLEKDPRDRPASALSVAAALPGGNALAAALEAGETPSPEMVAAAGPQGGLRPAIALSCLAAVLAGLVVVALLHGRTALCGLVPLDKPPAALVDDAREIVSRFGYTEPPKDSASWFVNHRPALQYFAEQDRSASRWEPLSEPGQIALFFRYRQSAAYLAPRDLDGRIDLTDPPRSEGDIELSMGLQGRLLYFLATPNFAEHSTEPPPEVDWSVVFEAAGLEMDSFEPIPPRMQPQVFGDARAAWKGVLPHRADLPVRVEAVALRGRPVFFETVTPYDPYWSEETARSRVPSAAFRVGQSAILTLLVLVAVGAAVLALRNWRFGRGDRKGALRLAFYVFALRLLYWLVAGHHAPSLQPEFAMLVVALGGALILAVLCWVLYLALEPYARRLWPEALVSWTRLLAGRVNDPLVGRDVLIGSTFGIGVLLIVNAGQLLPGRLGLPPPAPLPLGIDALAGGRWAFGELFRVQLHSLLPPLAFMVLLLFLRLILRKQWLAATVFVIIVAALAVPDYAPIGGEEVSIGLMAFGLALGVVWASILLVLILRFGVLALVATYVIGTLLCYFPITLDTSAPYFATSLFALLAGATLAGYACYLSLTGRRVFQDVLLRQPA